MLNVFGGKKFKVYYEKWVYIYIYVKKTDEWHSRYKQGNSAENKSLIFLRKTLSNSRKLA